MPLDMAQDLLDIIVRSLDFGSGFLDNDEVDQLRSLAVLIGVDPDLATPGNHICRFHGGHDWKDWQPEPFSRTPSEQRFCKRCHARDHRAADLR